MMIQIILTAALAIFILYAVFQFKVSTVISRLTGATSILGIVFVWYPDLTTDVAQHLGVGRGADLILYCFIVVGMFVSFYLQLRIQTLSYLITDLARAVALKDVRRPRSDSL